MSEPRTFDGVICFGGLDWWYHNRGHYDLQMMRELSKHVPVLYVNSIGMRVPRVGEGRMFFKRVQRKLKSFARGLVEVRSGFGVFSPVFGPGRVGTLTRPTVPLQIRRAARRLGIRAPLVWVACPPGEQFVRALGARALVYQRTDRFEAFDGVDTAFIADCNRRLIAAADVTLYCSSLLLEEERGHAADALFLDHGVDFEAFSHAGRGGVPAPLDVDRIPGPRVGFVGGIDAHTFDPGLFVAVARALPQVSFFLVGGCTLPAGWAPLPNVHLLGQRPYEQVPAYMAAADVLVMPWNDSDWVKACNPVKLKEYLAVGRPIVSTPFHELVGYQGLVRVAESPDAFARELRAALAEPHDPAPGRDRVRHATWAEHAERLLAHLAARGVVPLRSTAPR